MTRVLFVCVHNAGRSQMAEALLGHLSGGAVSARSAGSDAYSPAGVVVAPVMLLRNGFNPSRRITF